MSNQETVTARRILNLLEAQGYRCALSGRTLTPETASIDHIVPVAQGGTHDMGNVWIVDHAINIAKGAMTTEAFVSMCRDVAAHQANPACRDAIGTPPASN